MWCDFFPDGNRFATVSDRHLRFWNTETLRPEAAMEFDGFYRSAGAIFKDGKRICVCGRMDLFFLNVERMEMEKTFRGRVELGRVG